MKKILLAMALLGSSTVAMADALIYGGANVGYSDYNGESSTSYSVHVGTGILPIIGLEAGITNYGSFKGVDLMSYSAAVKPSFDFGPLHIYAKAGLSYWEKSGVVKDSDLDIMYGVGAELIIFGPFSVGASYTNQEIGNRAVDTFYMNITAHIL